jgi:ABC-type dipeptide/oligopeptide/nickel transport system permease component
MLVPVLIGVSVLVVLLVHLAPGDPARIMAGPTAPPDAVESLRRELGLDQPIYVQYYRYMSRAIQGDLGRSITTNRLVATEIRRTFPNTLELLLVASIWSILVAIPLGILAAMNRNLWFDKLSMAVSVGGVSVPIFVTGLAVLWIFAGHLGWFPVSGRGGSLLTMDGWRHIILPAFTLGSFQVAAMARVTRSTMLEVLGQDFVRTARAKGLRPSVVIYRHAFRNAMLPTITVIGLMFGNMLGGSVVTETIFSWPGVGRLIVGGISARDFPVVQGPILLLALLYVLINLLVDISYALLDPRVRYT